MDKQDIPSVVDRIMGGSWGPSVNNIAYIIEYVTYGGVIFRNVSGETSTFVKLEELAGHCLARVSSIPTTTKTIYCDWEQFSNNWTEKEGNYMLGFPDAGEGIAIAHLAIECVSNGVIVRSWPTESPVNGYGGTLVDVIYYDSMINAINAIILSLMDVYTISRIPLLFSPEMEEQLSDWGGIEKESTFSDKSNLLQTNNIPSSGVEANVNIIVATDVDTTGEPPPQARQGKKFLGARGDLRVKLDAALLDILQSMLPDYTGNMSRLADVVIWRGLGRPTMSYCLPAEEQAQLQDKYAAVRMEDDLSPLDHIKELVSTVKGGR